MDKPDDDLARNVAIIKERMTADVARLKTSLEAWIGQHSGTEHRDGGGSFYGYASG